MGILISFSGIDAAGKSTQIKLLSEDLKKKGREVYSTEAMFGYFLLTPIVRVGRTLTGSPQEGPVRQNKSFLGRLWFIPAFIDIWLGYIFNVRPKLKKYAFVLADRFYTDIWANLLYYGYLPDWAFGLVRLLPRPDIGLMLSLDPKVGQKRSSEFPLEYFGEQARIYRRLAQNLKLTIIDASRDPQVIFKEIKKHLHSGYEG